MALDIGIRKLEDSRDPLVRDLVVSIEQAELSCLDEMFTEIGKIAGVRITTVEDVTFRGDQLISLLDLIKTNIVDSKRRPDEWNQHVGFVSQPYEKLYEPMRRKHLLSKLVKLEILINRAIENRVCLYFQGD